MDIFNPKEWFNSEHEDQQEAKEPIYLGTEKIYVPTKGTIIPINEIKDAVFSEKMMGEGFGVISKDGVIYAPVSGVVQSVFITEHAISLLTDNGVEFLLHLGLNTGELQGRPFTVYVEEGQRVHHGDKIAEMALDEITRRHFDPTVVVVVTNSNANSKLAITYGEKNNPEEELGEIKLYR